MQEGIALLNGDSPGQLSRALLCFDEAIAIRRTLLLLTDDSRHRYDLAAGWMNRADALARIGSERLVDSVESYDHALRLLLDLPPAEDPLYPKRLAIAWINRGCVRQRMSDRDACADSLRCFRKARQALDLAKALPKTDLDLLLAATLTNLAGALLDAPELGAEDARELARWALHLVREHQTSAVMAAETALKARHVLCRAIAAESRDEKHIPPALITEATDAVDEGLALARQWEQRGEGRFGALAEDLFCFGCRVYQASQPRFLTEFVLENLAQRQTDLAPAANPTLHEVALGALWNAFKEIQRGDFQTLSTPRRAQVLENLRDLRVTEERVAQLRRTINA